MRTVETKVYQFSELSESAKEQAIQEFWDINVTHEWWESMYEDAENIGLKITGFDIDRNYCIGYLIASAGEVSDKIIKTHCEICETYKSAKRFLSEWDSLVEKYSDGIQKDRVTDENEQEFDNEAEDLEQEFLTDILNCYLNLLQREYEYQTSSEAIIDAIEANGCEFTETGEMF